MPPKHPDPNEVTVPAGSKITSRLPDAYFADAWGVIAADPSLPALGYFIKAMKATPSWVEACMSLRNAVVKLVGLKDLGGLSAIDQHKAEDAFRPGDRVGIFTLLENSFNEVLLGDYDKHLDVVLSVRRTESASGQIRVTITTVVHVHNWLGRLYMLPVVPMHKLIAPAVAKEIGRASR